MKTGHHFRSLQHSGHECFETTVVQFLQGFSDGESPREVQVRDSVGLRALWSAFMRWETRQFLRDTQPSSSWCIPFHGKVGSFKGEFSPFGFFILLIEHL